MPAFSPWPWSATTISRSIGDSISPRNDSATIQPASSTDTISQSDPQVTARCGKAAQAGAQGRGVGVMLVGLAVGDDRQEPDGRRQVQGAELMDGN